MNIKRLICRARGHQVVRVIVDGKLEGVSLIPKDSHPNPWVRERTDGPWSFDLMMTELKRETRCDRCGKRLLGDRL
jgi:hypothetical protein